MPSLTWSRNALRDIDRLYLFLEIKDREAAKRAVATIKRSVKVLKRLPLIRRPVEGLPPSVRERTIKFGSAGYVARYLISDSGVTIIAVRHMREARS